MSRICLLFFLAISVTGFGQNIKSTTNAKIEFVSDAPLEFISAKSDKCSGILNINNNELAFKVKIKSFEGFNSPLQQEHFNENYMESEEIPYATFTGKLLDDITYNTPGTYDISVKGTLDIHDVKDERIIELKLIVGESGDIRFFATFEVQLETHEIEVPKIVNQKISETISVTVNGTLN